MAAITWQNINAPDLAASLRPMEAAQRSFAAATGGLNELLKQREATQTANWDQGKTNNTQAFLDEVAKYRTPEEFQAAQQSGALDRMRQGFGVQVDVNAVRAAQEGRLTTLQQRALASQQYTDQKTRVDQRLPVAAFQTALLNAKTKTEADNIMLGAQGAMGNGSISPLAATELLKSGLDRGQNIVGQERATEDHTWKGQNFKKTWEHQAEQDRIARAKLSLDRAQVEEQRQSRLATASNAGVNARTFLLKEMGDLIKAQTAASQDIIKNVPFAAKYDSASRDKIHETATKLNGGDQDYGNSVLTKLDAYEKEAGIKIPVSIIESAMNRASNDTFNWTNSNRGYGRNVVDYVKDSMKDPKNITQMLFAEEQISKAKGMYKGSNTSDPVENKPLPPQLAFVPPKPVGDSTFVYNNPDRSSFNISSNKGIELPSDAPKGALSVTVKDGDTIHVAGTSGKPMTFRFSGLDAQETGKTVNGKSTSGQKFGPEAAAFVKQAIQKGHLEIKMTSNKPDAYGRHVADVFIDGKSLNEELLRRGLATVLNVKGDTGPAKANYFDKLQKEAIKNNLGIMGELGSDAVTGSAYRMNSDNLYK